MMQNAAVLPEIRLASFNIRTLAKADTDARNWENRKEAVADYLSHFSSGAICLQEVREKQAEYLKEKLADRFGVVYYVRDDKTNSEGLMTLYDKAVFALEQETMFWLSETPETMSLGWDATYHRICVNTRLRHLESGKQINLFNVHLDHGESHEPRVKGIGVVLERLRAAGETAVVTGDFNCKEDSLCYRTIAAELTDCQQAAPVTDRGVSFQRWGEIADDASTPIDFMFVTGDSLQPQSFAIDRKKWGDGNLYSDHYAICATLRFL